MAATLGWVALVMTAAAALPWLNSLLGGKGIGRSFGMGAWLSLAAVIVAVLALVINLRAMHPRSWAPVIAVIVAVPLAATYAFVAIMLVGLANMH